MEPNPKLQGKVWWLFLRLLFIVALAPRLMLSFSLRASPFFDLLVSDSAVYDAWARRLVAGEWLTEAGFFQAPLYPFFLAAHYKFFGEGLFAVRVTQAILGALSCVMIAESGRRFFSSRAGAIAGGILAIYPPAIFFDSLIHKPSLDLFLMSGILFATSLGSRRPWTCATLAGFSLGLLMLTRENAILLIPLLAAFCFLIGSESKAVRTAQVAVFLVALLGPHLIFGTWRTIPVIGAKSDKASIGLPLYMGNRHGASGMYEPLAGQYGNPQGEWIGAKVLAERETGREMNASEISSFWTRKTLSDIVAHPFSWLGLVVRKTLMTWNRVELSDVLDLRSHADYSPWLRWMGVVFHFGFLAPLAIGSAWILRARWREWWILGAMAILFSASVILFYVSARYRYPLVPILAILAGGGLDGVREFAQSAARRTRFRAMVVFLAALLFTNFLILPRRFERDQHSFSYANAGAGWATQGRDFTAIGCFERALTLMPDNEPALLGLGEALERNGEYQRALGPLSRALQLRPDRADTYAAISRVLVGLGRAEDGKPFYEQAQKLRAAR